jgi:hypothetical protein
MEAAFVFLALAYYDPSSRSSALYANFCECRRVFGRRSARDRGWLFNSRTAMRAGPTETSISPCQQSSKKRNPFLNY